MTEGHHGNGNGKRLDLNNIIEHYFLRLASRGMIVIGFPIIIWAANQLWVSFEDKLTDIQTGIEAVQEQQSIMYNDMDDIIDDLADVEGVVNLLEEEALTPFTHLIEHRSKKDWFNVTEPK